MIQWTQRGNRNLRRIWDDFIKHASIRSDGGLWWVKLLETVENGWSHDMLLTHLTNNQKYASILNRGGCVVKLNCPLECWEKCNKCQKMVKNSMCSDTKQELALLLFLEIFFFFFTNNRVGWSQNWRWWRCDTTSTAGCTDRNRLIT